MIRPESTRHESAAPTLEAVFQLLCGGVLDVAKLRDDIGSDPRMIAELLLLWEFDVGRVPPASTFSPFVEGYDDR